MVNNRHSHSFPDWVPETAARYVQHVEEGVSMREIARANDCHPSTVLRQIRKLEIARDDPLVDGALLQLSTRLDARPGALPRKKDMPMKYSQPDNMLPSEDVLNAEALRILPRLCENGAVLAVASEMENAVVVRENDDATARTAIVGQGVAQALALKEWISCAQPGRISRYRITASGRSALSRLVAESENRAQGFAETQAGFATPHLGEQIAPEPVGNVRFSSTDSPLVALARRRDRDGEPFLTQEHIVAGERLREDFELAQMAPRKGKHWDAFLSGRDKMDYVTDPGVNGVPAMARERVVQAMAELGEGLADIALRCCCFLEGLETAEKQLGWPARSAKIVLKIALKRLSEHYRSQAGGAERMIG